MRIKGRKRWGKGVLHAVGQEADKLIKEVRAGLTELREVEEPDAETVQDIGVFEGSLEALRWISDSARTDVPIEEFLDTADQALRALIEKQRSLTRYGGSHFDWREYASNIAWDRRTYAQIGHYGGEIDILVRMNRDFDLGLDPVLTSEARRYIY